MEYYNGKLCISMRELVDGGIMTIPNYKQLAARKKIDIARRGDRGGCALVVVDSFPPRYKEDIYTRFPDSDSVRLAGWVRSNYEIDQAAVVFFHDREKTGLDLKAEKIREYITNASVENLKSIDPLLYSKLTHQKNIRFK